MQQFEVHTKLQSHARNLRALRPVDDEIAVALWERDGGGGLCYEQPSHNTLSIYVSGGYGVRCLDNRTSPDFGQAGSICILPSARESRWTNSDYVSMLHVYFTDGAFERLTESRASFSRNHTYFRDRALLGMVNSFVLQLDWSDSHAAGALEHAVFAMLNKVAGDDCRASGGWHRDGLSGEQKCKVVEYIDGNVTSTIRVGDFAKELGVSDRTAARKIRASFGVPPYRLVIQRRVGLATAYIRNGESLATAAAFSGFNSQSHMARHFERVLGTTPGSLQRRKI